ncbi:hypothetical protein ACQ4WX_38375 [Streptomyces lasalocidi]
MTTHPTPPRPTTRPGLPRWVGPLYLTLSAILLPWIVHLSLSLPGRQLSEHYRMAWVGFDVFLLGQLARTGAYALRPHAARPGPSPRRRQCRHALRRRMVRHHHQHPARPAPLPPPRRHRRTPPRRPVLVAGHPPPHLSTPRTPGPHPPPPGLHPEYNHAPTPGEPPVPSVKGIQGNAPRRRPQIGGPDMFLAHYIAGWIGIPTGIVIAALLILRKRGLQLRARRQQARTSTGPVEPQRPAR